MARRMSRRVCLFVAVAAMPFALWLFVPVLSDGAPLQSRIEEKREQIEAKKRKERVLTTTIQGYMSRIDTLQGDITTPQAAPDPDRGRPHAQAGRARPAPGRAAQGAHPTWSSCARLAESRAA